MATLEINGRTWTSALGPNFSDEQIAEMLAWQASSEHVSPVAASDDLYRRCPTCWTGRAWNPQCPTCKGSGYVPVPDPAPPSGLLAAARAYFVNRDRADSLFSTGLWIGKGDVSKEMLACNERAMDAMDALRQAVEAAPEAALVALTDDEKRQVANRAITLTFRGYGPEKNSIDWCREIVDAFLSDLEELGFELRRRA